MCAVVTVLEYNVVWGIDSKTEAKTNARTEAIAIIYDLLMNQDGELIYLFVHDSVCIVKSHM